MQSSRGLLGHLRLVSCECGSASASLRMPDMSVPRLVRSLLSMLSARADNSCQLQRLLTCVDLRQAYFRVLIV